MSRVTFHSNSMPLGVGPEGPPPPPPAPPPAPPPPPPPPLVIVSVACAGSPAITPSRQRVEPEQHAFAVIRLVVRKRAEAERLLGVAGCEREAVGQSGVVVLGGVALVGLDQVDRERLLGGGAETDRDRDGVAAFRDRVCRAFEADTDFIVIDRDGDGPGPDRIVVAAADGVGDGPLVVLGVQVVGRGRDRDGLPRAPVEPW